VNPRIGVLSVQGAFIEHKNALRRLGADIVDIRKEADLKQPVDALVFPGGESTAMRRLIEGNGLFEALQALIADGIPVLGTCAGMILLSKEVIGGEPFFPAVDITVRRNAYGRQLSSFIFNGTFDHDPLEMVFIRAPRIERTGQNVTVLSCIEGTPVAVKEGNIILTAFHPELSGSDAVHRTLIGLVNKK
jgi:pyridoxal 5'-phosphate synthase pdxT subunit